MALYEKDGIISTQTETISRFMDFKDTDQLNVEVKQLDDKGISYHVSHETNRLEMYEKAKQKEHKLTETALVLNQGGYPRPEQYMKEIQLKDTEELLFIPGSYSKIEEYTKNFLNSKDFYTKNRVFYKLGLLLHGPPGNGKTSLIRYMVNNMLPKDCMKIWCNTVPNLEFVQEFKKSDKLKVFIFEELTTALAHHSTVKQFLEFMDGEHSVENSIVIATTNYPENLPGNVVDRKGRFDLIQKIDNPSNDDRAAIVEHYFKTSNDEMVELTNGMTFADIKEIYLLNKVHGMSFEDAVKDLKNHKELVSNTFAEKRKIGI